MRFIVILASSVVLIICSCGAKQGSKEVVAEQSIKQSAITSKPVQKYTCTDADTIFRLSNGFDIGLFGWSDPKTKPIVFSEFMLAVCEQDSAIGFWDAMNNYHLTVHQDTLHIEQLKNLPIGEFFQYRKTIWKIEKVYISKQKAVVKKNINKEIKKYSQQEIQTVLQVFETAKPGLDRDKMELANRLFMAAISGSLKARQYFKEFKNRFGTLDGAFSEEYNELTDMLGEWGNDVE